MKKLLALVLIFLLLWLSGCATYGPTDAEIVDRCQSAVETFFDNDVLHTHETSEVTFDDELMLRQVINGWYYGEDYYNEVHQNDSAQSYHAVIDGVLYVKYSDEEPWSDAGSAEGKTKHLVNYECNYTLEQMDYWKTEDNTIIVSFVKPADQNVQNDAATLELRETFIFDLDWNLIEIDIVSQQMAGVGEEKSVMTTSTEIQFLETGDVASVVAGIRTEIQGN